MSKKLTGKRFIMLPACVYSGNIYIKKKEALQILHKLVLRYIARNNNLIEVLNAFGINPRVINDVIVYLLYNNLIILDLDNNFIDVTEEITIRIQEETLDVFFREKHAKTISAEWVQERVTGSLIPGDSAKDYFQSEFYIDPDEVIDLRDHGIDKITPLDKYSSNVLVKSVKAFLKAKLSGEEGDILEQVERISDIHLIRNQPMYIPIRQKTFEEEKRSLYFIDAQGFPDSTIEKLTNKLNNEIVDFASDYLEPSIDPFVQYTFKGLSQQWQAILSQIERIVRDKAKKRKKLRITREVLDSLEQEEFIFLELLRDHLASLNKIKTYPFKGHEILDSLSKAFDLVKEFIIIGSAFFSNFGIDSLRLLFKKALTKNVRVILIWGLSELESSNQLQEIENFKQSLGSSLTGLSLDIQTSKQPFHSKFLIVDGNTAWITSCNLLNTDFKSETLEAVAWIEGGKIPLLLSEYALEKLETSSDSFNWLESRLVTLKENYIQTIDKKRRELLVIVEKEYQNLRESLEALSVSFRKKNLDRLTRLLKKWRQLLKQVENLPSGVLIENLKHRLFLLSCLRKVTNRINLSTDRIYEEAITMPLRKHFRDALNKGIVINVTWGREKALIPEKATEFNSIIQVIESLERDLENKIEIKKKPSGIHAKLLTIDSSITLITSYNLLAFGGTKIHDRSISGELGIVVSSKSETRQWNKFYDVEIPTS